MELKLFAFRPPCLAIANATAGRAESKKILLGSAFSASLRDIEGGKLS